MGEREAGALTGELVVGDNGIAQTAGFAHDGQGAVAHGDDLREAAGLKERRHEEHVGAGVHAAGEGGVESDARCHGARILVGEVAHGLLVIARAQNGNLDAAGKDAIERVGDQVHALLARKAGDHDHERAVGAHLKTQLLLERSLAGSLALHIAHVIVLGELVIGCRIPINGVDAVQDTAQDVVATTQNTVKMLAVLGRLNLGRIGGAHRGDAVGIVEGTEHVVDGVGIAAQLTGSVGDVCQAKHVVQDGVGELALEGDVVNREDRLHALIERQALVELAQKDGSKGGVPVVAVKHIAGEAFRKVLQAFGDGLGEECKALAIVKEAIGVAASKVVLVVDEEIGHSVNIEALETTVLVAPTEANVKVGNVLHLLAEHVGDGAVFGNHYDNVGAGALQRFGKGTGNVTQAASFNKGSRFGGSKHHLQFLSHGASKSRAR